MNEYTHTHKIGTAISRLRAEASVTQAVLAKKSELDQSRVSRIEKGEVVASTDVDRVLEALDALGAPHAREFKEYIRRAWNVRALRSRKIRATRVRPSWRTTTIRGPCVVKSSGSGTRCCVRQAF